MQTKDRLNMLNQCETSFYDVDKINNSLIKYVVIVSYYNGKWVFAKHKERSTWEIPGGTMEKGETATDAAKRELYEETGAIDFNIEKIAVYSLKKPDSSLSYGMLFFADISNMAQLPDSEIEKIDLFDSIPQNLTYPAIHPLLFEKVTENINFKFY